jgi:hypothetical protein
MGVALVLLLAGFAVARATSSSEQFHVTSIATLPAYQDAALLERAWRLPAAAASRASFAYQSNGSLCGPTSIANLQHSLGDASASAKSVLAGTSLCWTGICLGGLTLDAVAELARKRTGRNVTLLRDLTLAAFREQLHRSNDPRVRYLINFHRGPLFGTGHGHHSPIGGYLEDRDLVFVLDVNASFKPWLAPSERLFRAMDTVDDATSRKRGLVRIEP